MRHTFTLYNSATKEWYEYTCEALRVLIKKSFIHIILASDKTIIIPHDKWKEIVIGTMNSVPKDLPLLFSVAIEKEGTSETVKVTGVTVDDEKGITSLVIEKENTLFYGRIFKEFDYIYTVAL